MGGLGGRLARSKRIALYQTEEDSMRFLYQLCGCVAAAVFLLCAATAAATPIAPPDAQYNLDASNATCDGFDCAKAYVRQLLGTAPGTLQVGCSADVGAPNCAGSTLLAAPAPLLSVEASTALNHQSQTSIADSTVTYYYEVLCDTCSPGTLIPLSIGGAMEAHYVQGTGGTVTFGDLARSFVYGYNPVTFKDNVLVDMSMEGLGAIATDLTKNPNPLTGVPPNGFGFCESTWTGFYTCGSGPASPYGTVFDARVNEPYSIYLDAFASVRATNQPFSTSLAEVTIDPVISFAPGFDSTGFSIAESSGIGNEASTVPEPATWTLLLAAAFGWGCSRMLRRMQGKRSGVL
jgi:hypothetical protein